MFWYHHSVYFKQFRIKSCRARLWKVASRLTELHKVVQECELSMTDKTGWLETGSPPFWICTWQRHSVYIGWSTVVDFFSILCSKMCRVFCVCSRHRPGVVERTLPRHSIVPFSPLPSSPTHSLPSTAMWSSAATLSCWLVLHKVGGALGMELLKEQPPKLSLC